ncbi:Hypothetical protein PBC10988_20100 [Planctomycetales bacterium 10988]|nr:Hypothetical protein PBC10988_20100 [Planctomycetales bacterium 10988]
MSGFDDSFNAPPAKKSGGWSWLLLGCLGFFVVFGIACCGAGLYFSMNAATLFKNQFAKIIDETDLPEEDKRIMKEEVNRVAEMYDAGEIGFQDLPIIGEEIAKSPLLPLGIIIVLEQKYLNPSGLSEEEKTDGKRTLDRLARGVFEKKISEEEVKQIAEPITTQSGDGSFQPKDKVTDDELREFLNNAKTAVNEKNIPDEDYNINAGEEFRKAINRGIQRVKEGPKEEGS